MLATLDRGDTVLVPNPSYPIHIYGAIIAGADIRSVRMARGWTSSRSSKRAIGELFPKPKMLIIGFPSNPTAQCVELDFFEKVVALARSHGILVVHDLAYADITFDGWKAPSIMQVPGARDVAVEFFTMSKSYNMAGWRIGFMWGNKDLVNALARIKSYHDYGTFTPTPGGRAITALEGPQDWRRGDPPQVPEPPRRDGEGACTTPDGWSRTRRRRCTCGRGSRSATRRWVDRVREEVSSGRPRSRSPPGIGFGDYGDDHVRIALIENESRTAPGGARHQGHELRKDGVS